MANDEVKVVYKAVDQVSNVLKNITGNMTNSANKWQIANKKVRNSFANLNTDVNRASAGTKSFTNTLLSLGRIGSVVATLHVLGSMVKGVIESSMSAIETTNLFNVALGDMSAQAEDTVQKLNSLYGLDPTNIRSSIGTYAMLSRSMGMTSKQAETLSTSTTMLAIDLASLFNVSTTQAMQDLRSGLVGQSETVYKYGIDVTEAGIKQEALNQGISKSVREMSQGEKMALRYSVMLRQTALAQGDFARTLNTPANQLRILQDRFVTLSRSIGNIFIPMLSSILPYINAVVMWLITLANAIAKFFGYTESEKAGTGTGGFAGVAEDAEDATGAVGGATKAVKKFKQSLLGIDEINTLNLPTEDAGAGGGGGGAGVGGASILDSLNLDAYNNMLDGAKSKADEIYGQIVAIMQNLVKEAQPAIDAFKNLWNALGVTVVPFIFGVLEDFYNSFLVPVAKWSLGTGLPKFFDILTDITMSIDWGNLRNSLDGFFGALSRFTTLTGDTYLWIWDEFLSPIATWVGNELLPQFIDTLASSLDALGKVIQIAQPIIKDLWDNVLTPLGNWAGGIIVDTLKGIETEFSNFATSSEDVKTSAENIESAMGTLFDSLVVIGVAIGIITGIGGLATMAEGILGVAVSLESLGSLPIIGGLFTTLSDIVLKLAIAFEHVGAVISGVGAVPMALIIAVVALVAGALVSLWRTSQEFRDKWKQVFENVKLTLLQVWESILKPIFENIKDVILDIWEYGLKPLWEKWKEVWKNISLILADFINFLAPIIQAIIKYIGPIISSGLGNMLQAFKTVFLTISGIVGGLLDGIAYTFKSVRTIFEGVIDFITGIFTGNWKRAWEGVKGIFKGVFDSLTGIVKVPINLIISAINGLINGLNRFKINVPSWIQDLTGIKVGSFGFNIPTIPKLARGGMLDEGALFQAGEFGKAEMLGSYGGRTTVMPLEDTDFVGAMKEAVFSAMVSAMGTTDGKGDVVIEIGGTEFGRVAIDAINGVTKKEGKLLLNT